MSTIMRVDLYFELGMTNQFFIAINQFHVITSITKNFVHTKCLFPMAFILFLPLCIFLYVRQEASP